MEWTKFNVDQWKCHVPEGEFWIGDDTGTRSGKFEIEFTTADNKTRTSVGKTKSLEAAQKKCESFLKALRTK
jgi:hypothetical protein